MFTYYNGILQNVVKTAELQLCKPKPSNSNSIKPFHYRIEYICMYKWMSILKYSTLPNKTTKSYFSPKSIIIIIIQQKNGIFFWSAHRSR